MDNKDNKKKRKKKADQTTLDQTTPNRRLLHEDAIAYSGGEKEHKVPWQEKYATPKEIKAFLSDHIYLRYNTVKHRVEARLPAEDAFCQNSELAQFVSDDYQPMSDRLSNQGRRSIVLTLNQ